MSGDYLVIGRFCLGLLLIGGLYLWVRLMRNLDRLPPAVDCLLASRIHYGLAGGIVGYTALPELQALFAEVAVLGVVFSAGGSVWESVLGWMCAFCAAARSRRSCSK